MIPPLVVAGMRKVGFLVSRIAARARVLSLLYLETLGTLSRFVGSRWIAQRLASLMGQVVWPDIQLRFRSVASEGVFFSLRPHLGEFDQEALFSRELTYEAPVFRFLGGRMAKYDTVLEIGANVGIYTVFFSRSPGPRPARIYAFEPSREAFRRLVENLNENKCENVEAFPIAVADATGFIPFFEPKGHLTNGSFSREFAAIFSSDVRERRVPALHANALEGLISEGNVLLKVDAEGAEPDILRAFLPLLEKYSPDLLVEVLAITEREMNALAWPAGYQFFEICAEGPVRRQTLNASLNRDYFLTARPKGHGFV